MSSKMSQNVRFREPSIFEPPTDNSNQNLLPSPQSNIVILPSITRTIRFFKPMFLQPLGSSKDRDSTLYLEKFLVVFFKTTTPLNVQMLLFIRRKTWTITVQFLSVYLFATVSYNLDHNSDKQIEQMRDV